MGNVVSYINRAQHDEGVSYAHVVDGAQDEADGERAQAGAAAQQEQHRHPHQHPEHHQQHGVIDRPRWGGGRGRSGRGQVSREV